MNELTLAQSMTNPIFTLVIKLRLIVLIAVTAIQTGCANLNSHALPISQVAPVATLPISQSNIIDIRGDFRKALCDIQNDHGDTLLHNPSCDKTLHRLLNEPKPKLNHNIELGSNFRENTRIIIVPGIFGECVKEIVTPFQYARSHLEEDHGYNTSYIEVSGRSGPETNGQFIANAVLELLGASSEEVIFIGYSKGAIDILQAIVSYPELADKTLAVVSLGSPIGGTPAADGASKAYEKLASKANLTSCNAGDGEGVKSLRRDIRQNWLSQNPLPKNIKYYSLSSFTNSKNISRVLRPSYHTLALHDKKNDSNILASDGIIPGSYLLGYLNGDHWAIALPFSENNKLLSKTLINKNEFPREAVLEAIIKIIEISESDSFRTDLTILKKSNYKKRGAL